MGLLDKLWDDTVAGPQPESGLGKLRKHAAFSPRSPSGKESEATGGRPFRDDFPDEAVKVTRSIMIVKPSGYASPPISPAGSTPPVSPFSGGGRNSNRFRRRSTSDGYERPSETEPRSPASHNV